MGDSKTNYLFFKADPIQYLSQDTLLHVSVGNVKQTQAVYSAFSLMFYLFLPNLKEHFPATHPSTTQCQFNNILPEQRNMHIHTDTLMKTQMLMQIHALIS